MSGITIEVLSSGEDQKIVAEDEAEGGVSHVFSCKYCNFQSTDIDDLDEHIISHDEAILEDISEDETESSGEIYFTKFAITTQQAPKRLRQSVPAFYNEFSNKPDKRVFVCPYCGYQTMKRLDMNKHLQVHNEPVEVLVYACAECPYTTRRKCDMQKHLLTHCKDESVTIYKCIHCTYTTKRKGDLSKHITICHSKEDFDTLYQCHECIYSTRRRGDLKKHLTSHKNHSDKERENLFNCTECGYTSKRLNDLHKHVVLHCDRTVKGVLKCTKCDYATKVTTQFAKHVLSHCQVGDMNIAILPKESESMQDYIVVEEDELHRYQLDKERFTSVKVLEKEGQSSKGLKKRKRVREDIDQFYVDGEEEIQSLHEVDNHGRGEKVLVLAGYEGDEKAAQK